MSHSDAIITTASLAIAAVVLAAKGEFAWAWCAFAIAAVVVCIATRGWQRAAGETAEGP